MFPYKTATICLFQVDASFIIEDETFGISHVSQSSFLELIHVYDVNTQIQLTMTLSIYSFLQENSVSQLEIKTNRFSKKPLKALLEWSNTCTWSMNLDIESAEFMP